MGLPEQVGGSRARFTANTEDGQRKGMNMAYVLSESLIASLGEGIEDLLNQHGLVGTISFDIEASKGNTFLNSFEVQVDSDFIKIDPQEAQRAIERRALEKVGT